jgi:uncharacterized membrane protein YjgN (DUF898 family)
VPPPGGPMMAPGVRAQFSGDGGQLLVSWLLYAILPIFVIAAIFGGLVFVGAIIDQQARAHGAIQGVFGALGGLVYFAGILGVQVVYTQKFYEFYYQQFKLDGHSCQYTGTMQGLAGKLILNAVLTGLTMGIYAPWAIVNLRKYCYENVVIDGQRGRLTFDGSPGELLGKFIVGMLLTYCTAGIYMIWFYNDLCAFKWEHTKLDGRAFSFRKDPGGFFGTYLINMLLTYCTAGIYSPWMMCNLIKWEAERVA